MRDLTGIKLGPGLGSGLYARGRARAQVRARVQVRGTQLLLSGNRTNFWLVFNYEHKMHIPESHMKYNPYCTSMHSTVLSSTYEAMKFAFRMCTIFRPHAADRPATRLGEPSTAPGRVEGGGGGLLCSLLGA